MKTSFTKTAIVTLTALCTVGCDQPNSKQEYQSVVKRENFQKIHNGRQIDLYYLKNSNGIQLAVTNFGGRVVELLAPDRDGVLGDIVLGNDNVDKYINYKGERFLGATIGRYGNRIAKGRFTLNGIEYTLAQNNGVNTLHGGDIGFDMVVWDAQHLSDSVLVMTYTSADMEEGYPGTLNVEMTYELNYRNEFKITHSARTDKDTPVNLTHHSFFNLSGEGNGTINEHILTINASRYTPIDSTLIPIGTVESVEGTPMDFRRATAIGSRLEDNFEQLAMGNGYDHNWVLDRETIDGVEFAAKVVDPSSGRTLEVWTTEPAIQFYGGNFFDGTMPAKNGGKYDYRGSFALETQHYPDSPNQPDFPSTILKSGAKYHHICIYKFGVE